VDRSSRDSVATIIIAAGLILAIFQDLPSFGKATGVLAPGHRSTKIWAVHFKNMGCHSDVCW
jgi:hypothetical protein